MKVLTSLAYFFLDRLFHFTDLNFQPLRLLVEVPDWTVMSLGVPWERFCPAIDLFDCFQYHPSLLQEDAHVDAVHDYTLHESVWIFHRVVRLVLDENRLLIALHLLRPTKVVLDGG